MDKKLILIRGTSGSGKSTLAEMMSKALGGKAFAADDFFMLGGEYKWDPLKLGEAHAWCQSAVEDELQSGSGIAIVHNTLVTEKQVAEYTDIAERTGATLISIIVERRHSGKNVHGVPDGKVQQQAKQLRQAIKLC
jgi:predicted kinase